MQNISPTHARQLAIYAQRLAEPLPAATKSRMRDILASIRCLQLDPIRAVERTQFLVLWSRLGNYDRDWLHQLTYVDKALFEYWAHAASIVLMEDYEIHHHFMSHYATDPKRRLTNWIQQNENFKRYVLAELDRRGPTLTQELEDRADIPWGSSGWTNNRSLPYMLDYLWTRGEIAVSDRDGLKRWWDLAHRVYPQHQTRYHQPPLEDGHLCERAVPLALKGLGIGRERDIRKHFIEGRYKQLGPTLKKLVNRGVLTEALVPEWGDETWYLVSENLPVLEELKQGRFYDGRTTLLSPFDGLIRNRDRTELMWDFYYRIEIYVPKAKRQYGYYVLPILQGDRLIGRIDSRMDRKSGTFNIHNVYAEAGFKPNPASGKAVKATIEDLGRFVGAKRIDYLSKAPRGWQSVLK